MHDAAPSDAVLTPELQASPLYNHDLAPVPPSRRNWTTYNFAALWISMAHCIPTYVMAGGMLTLGMNWWQALLTIGLGSLIVLVPILLNAHPGTKYGIPFPVLARSSFGTRGANIPALLRAVVACGWFGIQTYFGGEAVRTFIGALWPEFLTIGDGADFLGLTAPSAITFFLFWGLNMLVIYRGMNAVRIFENWAAPLVLIMTAVLLVWAVSRAGGVGPLLDKPSTFGSFGDFWTVFMPQLTGVVSFWATLSLNIPDFTRYGRGQKEQIKGQALGLPTTMVVFSAMGLLVTSASAAILPQAKVGDLWNPEYLLAQMTSSTPPAGLTAPLIDGLVSRVLVAIFALLGIAIATISVNIAANVVSPANDFANLAPKRISFRTGALITGILGILMCPWKLMADAQSYVFNWLGGYGMLLGPIAAIMIADYWILRKRELDVPELYRVDGRYAGTNWVAVGALVLGIAPNVPGFLASSGIVASVPGLFSDIYPYTWFTGFALAFGLYLAGMALWPRQLGRAGHGRN